MQPTEAQACGLIVRSGLVRAMLAPRIAWADVSALPERPLQGMKDMGMYMSSMDMGQGGVIDLSQLAMKAWPATP